MKGSTSAAAAPDATVPAPPSVRIWLWLVALLILAMVVVGGATRLTDSGLSITEWRPILGAIPPLGEADWLAAFDKYKRIPEYKLVNKGMSLEAFKVIYWWEWGHRFLGRFIGLAFALPFAWFWLRGRIGGATTWKLAGILALGGLQGVVGWYMVMSGLVERVDVSQYRLALHLGLALLIFALVVWLAIALAGEHPLARGEEPLTRGQRRAAWALLGLLFLQLIAGAFVAGTKAGLVYNTWPLMDGRLIPDGLGQLSPWWLNLFETGVTIQFAHRILAYVLVVAAIAHAGDLMRRPETGWAAVTALGFAAAVLAQAGFGIWTLLARVPLSLGLLHQGWAVVVLGLAVGHAHACRRQGAIT